MDSSPPLPELLQVVTALPSREAAEGLGRDLVAQRLAGCVQIVGPIRSIYHWQARIETADEWICVFKTTESLYDSLEAALIERHPYAVPEVIAVPAVRTAAGYREWLASVVDVRDPP